MTARLNSLLRSVLAERCLRPGLPSMDDLAAASAELIGNPDLAVQLRLSHLATSAVGASSDRARAAEEEQLTMEEGPSIDARRGGIAVAVRNLAADHRWPAATARMVSLGIGAVEAFPLRVGAIHLGSMTNYLPRVQAASNGDGHAGDDVAAAVLEIVLGPASGPASNLGPDGLQPITSSSLENRAVVHQATGMVAVQLDCPPNDAYVRLQAHAFANAALITHVAEMVLSRTLRFER